MYVKEAIVYAVASFLEILSQLVRISLLDCLPEVYN